MLQSYQIGKIVTVTERAGSSALRLLQRTLEAAPGGRVFTSRDAIVAGAELGFGSEHTYKMLSSLVDRGLVDRPRGGLYVMRPPFGGPVPVRPLVIAVHAVTPAAVSGDTALAHWGLLGQAPLHEEVVSTPTRIQWRSGIRADGADRLWAVGGTTIRFHRIPLNEMFGITSVRLDSDSVVPIFDRERALLELLGSGPDRAEWAEELLGQHHPEIDHARLLQYAERVELGEAPAAILASTRRRRRSSQG